ncbi:MAG TPA: hypothetical protein PK402_00895, partial [Tepidisphaeraceae bacterium]|nr:hypothetical protein [Tepidisphaeraceae bacterium]
AGDRSALDAILTSWLPEARSEFELRRKQAAYRAMSQLKGASVDLLLATVFVHPSKTSDELLDLVWIIGLLGLQRLRPGAAIKFATRRVSVEKSTGQPRHPLTLDGTPVEDFSKLLLEEFSSTREGIDVRTVGDATHYSLAGERFGPASAIDLVFGEANVNELPRYVDKPRKRFVFAEISTPAKQLVFDAFVHRSLTPGDPELMIYDTAFEGIASANDPARDIDRMDLSEAVTPLGEGLQRTRTAAIPFYSSLLEGVCTKLNWQSDEFKGWRSRIDYPIYGSQVVMAWDALVKKA